MKLTNGGNARVKVLAMRKGYEGAIAIELRDLPNGMTADKVSIGKREDRVEIEIKAGATVGEGDRVDVYAIGTPVGITERVESPRFTVSVDSVGQPPGLELRVEPATVNVAPGASVKIRATVVRKGYAGPVVVELRNLPAEVEASQGTIPAGQNTVEMSVTARAKAVPGSKADVCAVGAATAAGYCAYASPQFTLQVTRK